MKVSRIDKFHYFGRGEIITLILNLSVDDERLRTLSRYVGTTTRSFFGLAFKLHRLHYVWRNEFSRNLEKNWNNWKYLNKDQGKNTLIHKNQINNKKISGLHYRKKLKIWLRYTALNFLSRFWTKIRTRQQCWWAISRWWRNLGSRS